MDFISNILPDGVLRAGVLATARHVASWAAASITAYLLAHHASQSDAASVSEAVSALIIGLASYGFSLWDVKNVDTKIKVASQESATTQPVTKNDETPKEEGQSSNNDKTNQSSNSEIEYTPKQKPFGDIP